jgi:hypothetical protein
MDTTEIPEPLRTVLKERFNINLFWTNWDTNVRSFLQLAPGMADAFREQFARAIRDHSISPEQYKELTQDPRHKTPEDLNEWLRDLWVELYDDEPINGEEPPEEE